MYCSSDKCNLSMTMPGGFKSCMQCTHVSKQSGFALGVTNRVTTIYKIAEEWRMEYLMQQN